MKRWSWRWGPAVLQMALIFVASSIPNLQRIPGDVSDKTAHFIAYAVLGVCLFYALAAGRWRGFRARHAWRALVLSSFYGASDEFHQHFVPGRSPDVHDWVADTLGAGLAILVLLLLAAITRSATARPDERDV